MLSKVPRGHWKTTSFLAALRTTGLVAPLVVDGSMNGELFLTCVRRQLVPTLAQEDVVVVDNLPAHKVQGVRQANEQVGARVLYLPPYSPDFNPIEQVFAKLEALLRAAAQRTLDELCQAIAHAVELFTPQECLNYIRKSGYATGT